MDHDELLSCFDLYVCFVFFSDEDRLSSTSLIRLQYEFKLKMDSIYFSSEDPIPPAKDQQEALILWNVCLPYPSTDSDEGLDIVTL